MNKRTGLGEARAKILRQHAEIRARMRGIDRTATAIGKPGALQHLRASLLHFAAIFDEHLAFEERQLIPLVRDLDAWGPAREEVIREEHAEQRARLEQLCALAEEPTVTRHELVGEVHWLMHSLLEDMDHEEVGLASLECLENSGAEQMTG